LPWGGRKKVGSTLVIQKARQLPDYFWRCFSHTHKVSFKLTSLIFSFVYIIVLFSIALSEFRTEDSRTRLNMISMDMRKLYREFTSPVRTGLHIKNFSSFDFVANNFVVDATVWFEFDSHQIMLKTIEGFSFDNSKMIYKSKPIIKIHDSKMFVQYNVIFEAKTDLDFRRFPLTDHYLTIVLTNNQVSPNEMYFDDAVDAVSFSVSDKVFTSNWAVHALSYHSGFSSVQLDKFKQRGQTKHPKVAFEISFKKDGVKKIMVLLIPIFAAMFISLISFLLSLANKRGKSLLVVTAVTALLGYRFVIETMSPKVGYFTTIDNLYLFFIIAAFSILIFQLILSRQYSLLAKQEKIAKANQAEGEKGFLMPKFLERLNSAVYIAAWTTFVTMVTYLVVK
jgi:hypothetical protein